MAQPLQADPQPKNIRKMLSQTHVAPGLSLCGEVSRIKAHPLTDLEFDLHNAKVSNPETSTTGKFGGEIDNPKPTKGQHDEFLICIFSHNCSRESSGSLQNTQ